METTSKLDITIISLSSMDKLAVGDIFLFFADGWKYVFLGITPDGRYCYKRCEMRSKRIIRRRRNIALFKIDADGGLFIVKGKLFFNLQSAIACATRQ